VEKVKVEVGWTGSEVPGKHGSPTWDAVVAPLQDKVYLQSSLLGCGVLVSDFVPHHRLLQKIIMQPFVCLEVFVCTVLQCPRSQVYGIFASMLRAKFVSVTHCHAIEWKMCDFSSSSLLSPYTVAMNN
jgi:hypothetical protein